MTTAQRVMQSFPRRATTAVALLTGAAIYAYSLHKPDLALMLLVAATLATVVAVHQIARHPVAVQIAPGSDEVRIQYRKWRKKWDKLLSLSQFKLVRSFSRGAPLPVTVVELATDANLPQAFLLASYEEPTSVEKRFFAVPRFVEASAARELRLRLAEVGRLHDQGYLGEFDERRALDIE